MKMIDIAEKERTSRVAIARAELRCSRETLKLLNEGRLEKGDALAPGRRRAGAGGGGGAEARGAAAAGERALRGGTARGGGGPCGRPPRRSPPAGRRGRPHRPTRIPPPPRSGWCRA